MRFGLLFSEGFRYNKALILDPSKKGIGGPVNSLVYNLPLLIFLAEGLVINTEDVNLLPRFQGRVKKGKAKFLRSRMFFVVVSR